MKRKRVSVKQIVAVVKQHEFGTPVGDIVCGLGIAGQAFCWWKKRYGRLEPIEGSRFSGPPGR